MVVAVAILAVAASALAGKSVSDFIGVQGSTGSAPGQFNNQAGLDVNDPDPGGSNDNDSLDPYGNSTDGYLYVADEDNHRIQVFDDESEFVFSFGGEVNATAPANLCPRPGFPGDDCAKAGNDVVQTAGYLDDPQGVAIDQVTGDVYVSDQDNIRIQKFTAAGEFVYMLGNSVNQTDATSKICPRPGMPADVCEVGVAGTGDGDFGSTMEGHPAVDPNTQDLWVPDVGGTSNRRMQKFDKDGAFLLKFGGNGTGIGLFGTGTPNHVAVDDASRIYVLDDSQDQIERFNSDGTGGAVFAGPELSGSPEPGRIAIDHNGPGSADDSIYVVKPNGSANNSEVKELDENGTLVDTHMENSGIPVTNAAGGLALNPADGRIYFSTESTGHEGIYVVDDLTGPLVAEIDPATDVEATTATLNATINPNGSRTSFHLEISKDGITYNSIPVPDADAGTGTTAQQVSFPATGLEANTFYRVRLVATRLAGDQITTGDLTFLTDPAEPLVDTDGASHVTDTTAQLNGRVNPGGLPTTYWFEWGTNTYGNQAPAIPASAGSGGVIVNVAETIAGLAPDAVYHHRLCAQNPLAPAPVCGPGRTFSTRSTAVSPAGRAYEMVTSPDKVLRRGGEGNLGQSADYSRLEPWNYFSPDGEKVLWQVFGGVSDPDAGGGFAHDRGWEVRTRLDRDGDGSPDGWVGDAVVNVPTAAGATAADSFPTGISADLETQTWSHASRIFPASPLSTRVMGSTGGPLGAGWFPTVDPAWTSALSQNATFPIALTDDQGERWVGTSLSNGSDVQEFRVLVPQDDTLSPSQLSPPQTSGAAQFMFGPPQWRPLDLINECTGTLADDPTELPARSDAGTPADPDDDTVGVRLCAQGSPTDIRGASLGASSRDSAQSLQGTATTAMSDAGDRVFFLSPDPATKLGLGGNGADVTSGCTIATAAASNCQPQLFVRQYDDAGTPTVRWISRSRGVSTQEVGLLSRGASFEGAARDGSVVYFRTNAPLTTDDPNGAGVASPPGGVTSGTASPNSWDLYRYELPGDNNVDPDAGALTRISGGPGGGADPNTNCTALATSGAQTGNCWGAASSTSASNGSGAAARFISDDGDRVYFVTAARIPDADNASPTGGSTTPTDAGAQVNTESRNLYLYDAGKSGAAAYKFIARIPFSTAGATLNSCASFNRQLSGTARGQNFSANSQTPNCVHGTTSGDAVTFETDGQLTADDSDSAGDVYLYDAASDQLVRVSAPPPDASPYTCLTDQTSGVFLPIAVCNGDLGASGVNPGELIGLAGLRHMNIAEDANGALTAVYFESRAALAPGAAANDAMKVYEYRRVDGRTTLISPPGATDSAFYRSNSRDGGDVFYWTEQRISGWEIDVADGDIYNATTRPDPIAEPGPAPQVCVVLAGGCHPGGASLLPAQTKTMSSSGSSSGDNVASGERKRLVVSGLSRKARRRAASTGVLAVRVRTNRAGLVRVLARAKIGRRTRRVAGRKVRVREAGAVTVKLHLNRAAKRRLRRGQALKVTLRVASAGARTRTATVHLERGRRS